MLWEYGGYASEGVRQVAELGSPIKMEEEIRQKVEVISNGDSVSHSINDVTALFPCLSICFLGLNPRAVVVYDKIL